MPPWPVVGGRVTEEIACWCGAMLSVFLLCRGVGPNWFDPVVLVISQEIVLVVVDTVILR
jgi:hypothetical protein